MIRKPFYRKFRQGFYETLSEKGASVLRYRGADNKEHYIAAGDSADVMPGGGMVETTWQELKDMRDGGKLTAGTLYRITDYTTTTAQEMTQAAGHDFDVIVLALGSRSLSEDAWAAPRDGDGYFCDYENEGGEILSVEEVEALAEQLGAELPPPREDGSMYWPDKLVLRWEETISQGMITVEGHGSGMIGTTPYFDPLTQKSYYQVSLLIPGDRYCVDSLTPTPGVSRIYRGTYNIRFQRWVYTETDMVVATFEPGVAETHTETLTKRSALNQWRLKYCLDNDAYRFAWADSSTEEVVVEESIGIIGDDEAKYVRNPLGDVVVHGIDKDTTYYAWDGPERTLYTTTLDIVEEVTRALAGTSREVQSFYITTHEVVSEDTGVEVGRGVIYRLTDEWGNSLPFDFKNIKLDYEESGEYTFVFGGNPDVDHSLQGECFYVTMGDCFFTGMYIPLVKFIDCYYIRLGYGFAGEVANCNNVDVGDWCELILEDVKNVTYANDGGRVLTENNYSEIINAQNS